jgi:hypothetical protein
MSRRATVEESRSIELDYLESHDLLKPGNQFPWNWTYRGHLSGSITIRVLPNGVRLIYQYRKSDLYTGEIIDDVYELVRLEWGVLGGYRVYFICPRCGRRTRDLHMPPGSTRFGCRICYNLAYNSQQETRNIWTRLLPRDDERPRRGSNIRGRWRAVALATQAFLSDDQADDDPLAHLTRKVKRSEWRWGSPGRPTKKAVRARQDRERLRRKGLLDAFGNPIPKVKRRPGRPKEKRDYVWRQPRSKHPPGEGEAYCVKCKCARRLVYARNDTLSNGRPAIRGRCQVCRTRLCRILPHEPVVSYAPSRTWRE